MCIRDRNTEGASNGRKAVRFEVDEVPPEKSKRRVFYFGDTAEGEIPMVVTQTNDTVGDAEKTKTEVFEFG